MLLVSSSTEALQRVKRLASVGSWGSGDAELRHPWGVAVAQKRVYVTDQGNDRICVFSADKLAFLFSFGGRGRGMSELLEPRYVLNMNPALFHVLVSQPVPSLMLFAGDLLFMAMSSSSRILGITVFLSSPSQGRGMALLHQCAVLAEGAVRP